MKGASEITFGAFEQNAGEDQRERFARVRERLYAERMAGVPVADEPVPTGALCLLATRGDEPVARCTLLEARDLVGAPGLTGMVGHYEAIDRAAGVALLSHACRTLAARGVARVLGPMNGNTWARYRLALPPEPGDPAHAHPYFAGEPINPPEYPEHFRTAGFEVVARYESRADDHPGAASPAAEELGRRVEEAGVSVRTLDPARFDDEIRAIFELSLAGFAGNLYYSPIDFDTFRAMYERVREILDRELILLAQGRDGKPLSFFYAFPDPWSAEGGRPTRVVAKSMATLPEARGLGLGRHLFDLIRRRAHEKGYRSVLHALMHVDNVSRSLSERHASRLFRRYALYQWKP